MQHATTIGEAADRLSRELPGHRVEILQGRVTVTPPADGAHAVTLTGLIEVFLRAGVRETGLKVVQAVGLWLPTGPDDYAVPDLAVVDPDFKDAHVQKNCYAPNVFRMALEVTSSNWADDLTTKVECYAEAGVPVYVVVDRKHDQVLLYADPSGDEYRTCSTHKRGTTFQLPSSVGVPVKLDVDRLLDGDD
ncbi:MAG: Uma2 family endonuclease [Streptomyces sp.]